MRQSIKSIYVKGLWNIKDVSLDLSDDINILIGGNGTGKTTILTLIEALLNLDFRSIEDIVFEKVTIVFMLETEQTIVIERLVEDLVNPVFRYIFEDEIIDIRITDIKQPFGMRGSSRVIYVRLKNKLQTMVNVSWLSVNRLNNLNNRNDRFADADTRDSVSAKLSQLMNQIVSYRLQLETRVNERTKKFNEDLVSLLLYNEEYDRIPKADKYIQVSLLKKEEIVTRLHRVFSYFGDARVHTTNINKHANKIQEIINCVKEKKQLDTDDILAFSLFNRTLAIFDLSESYQTDRATILEPLKTYVDIVGQYMEDKELVFDDITGEFTPSLVYNNNKKVDLSIHSLSSGERQILILLTETLLQQKRPYVFIADEPELSLHIEWQRKLISSIMELNPNVQIIFATHSPEIAANYPQKLIYLNSVTRYVE